MSEINQGAEPTGDGSGHYRPDLQDAKAKETVRASLVADNGFTSATAVQVAIQPTQVRRPWRATARTVFQGAVALATLLPFVASGVYGDGDNVPAAVVQVLAVSAAITRVMALPQVEVFLRRFLPFLAATPKEKTA